MPLFAIAGGAGPGDENLLSCCGLFPIMPLVGLLTVAAFYRNSVRAALGALLLAGVPYVLLRHMVAGYSPSEDGDVVADQVAGRRAVAFYGWLVALAGLSAVCALGRQVCARGGAAVPQGVPGPPTGATVRGAGLEVRIGCLAALVLGALVIVALAR